MMMRISPMLLVLLAACSAATPPTEQGANPAVEAAAPVASEASVPGSDRDSHGCIASAGYRWCDKSQQCERPWELAKQHGFDNTTEAFDQYCGAADAAP